MSWFIEAEGKSAEVRVVDGSERGLEIMPHHRPTINTHYFSSILSSTYTILKPYFIMQYCTKT